jgi:pyruvate/2-oxoglutarate dehydrogenase complex dihydrolipoamide dehydrogenase (E3) component
MAASAALAGVGHRVTLVEKSDELGGQLKIACLPPTRGGVKQVVENLTRELTEADVEVITGMEADKQLIEELRPDRIVLAVGSRPDRPDIEGLETADVVFPEQALVGSKKIGQRVAVIGGRLVGAEIADFLSAKGHQVALIEMHSDVAADAVTATKVYLVDQLALQKVQVICRARVVAVAPGKVSYIQDGWRFTLEEIDTIVLATGTAPETRLATDLSQAGIEFEQIGDCLTPSDAMVAIYQGYRTALR